MRGNFLILFLLLFRLGFSGTLESSLFEYVKKNDYIAVSALLYSGAEVDSRDENGWTPLMWASNRGFTKVAKLLLDSGADPNATTPDLTTPLIETAFAGNPETAKLLLDYGANKNHKDVFDKDAQTWAKERGNIEVFNLLSKY